jgi:hypothetical protein
VLVISIYQNDLLETGSQKLNPNLSIEIVTRGESSIISSVPARIYEEEIVTPILTNKFEETLEMEEISLRSRFSIN